MFYLCSLLELVVSEPGGGEEREQEMEKNLNRPGEFDDENVDVFV